MSKKKNKVKRFSKLRKTVVILAIVIIGLSFVKLNYFKPMIEKEVSKAIEMPFKINGNVGLGLAGIYPAISVEDIILDGQKIGSYNISINPFAAGVDIPKITGSLGKGRISAKLSYIGDDFKLEADVKNMSYKELDFFEMLSD